MKANEFVKKFGWEEARKVCSGVFSGEVVYKRENINIDDLKRLVKSHELLEKHKNKHGGIRFRIRWGMYRYGDTQQFNDRLKQAIADVESCQ